MMSKIRIEHLLDWLDASYPWDNQCYLAYSQPWQLLVATILSAQCTDDRVNQVTPVFFGKYPTLESIASADIASIEDYIRSTGFYHMKAKYIKGSAQAILTQHDGVLPSDIESLTALPGVGRKTANVLRGHVFGIPSIVVDTHVARVSRRIGLTKYTDPHRIEMELMEVLPQTHWIKYNHQIIAHGRKVCKSRKPRCESCGLAQMCPSAGKS